MVMAGLALPRLTRARWRWRRSVKTLVTVDVEIDVTCDMAVCVYRVSVVDDVVAGVAFICG